MFDQAGVLCSHWRTMEMVSAVGGHAGFNDGDDVRMIQLFQDARLAAEACQRGIVGQRAFSHYFQREPFRGVILHHKKDNGLSAASDFA